MMKNNLKNKKIMRKRNKGITLIALVITIIVLLILAGVSITMLTGDNGILKQAINARERTRGGEVQETVNLAATSNEGVDYIGGTIKTRADVIKELKENKKLTPEEVELLTNENNPVDVITIGGITIDFSVLGASSNSNTLVAMFKKAEEDRCTNADGTCTREDHLHIGDYVNYTNPTSGGWTVPAGELGGEDAQTYLASQNQLNWRVLGIEGTGDSTYIKLIAGSPMKKSKSDKSGTDESNPYLYMKGAKSYINAVEQLNKICAICKNDSLATKAESVTMNDIDQLTGVTTDALKRQYNLDQFYGGKNYGDSYSFENHYKPQSWLTSTKTTVSGTVNGYYYSINSQDGSNPYVTMSNNRIYNMLFNNVELGKEKAYWLASVGVRARSGFAHFGPAAVSENVGVVYAGTYSLFSSINGFENESSFAVRPVVSLKSGVTKEQCSKTTDKNETTWNVGGDSGGGSGSGGIN